MARSSISALLTDGVVNCMGSFDFSRNDEELKEDSGDGEGNEENVECEDV